jgi:GNAT superfamily N-acetyltransferase
MKNINIREIPKGSIGEKEKDQLLQEFTEGVHTPAAVIMRWGLREKIFQLIATEKQKSSRAERDRQQYFDWEKNLHEKRVESAMEEKRLFGLYEKGELSAIGAFEENGSTKDGRLLREIALVVVKKEYRGRKYSRKLTDYIIEYLKAAFPKDLIGRKTRSDAIAKNSIKQGFKEISLSDILQFSVNKGKDESWKKETLAWFHKVKEQGENWRAYIYDPIGDEDDPNT